MAEKGGEGSDGGSDEEVVDQQPGRQRADRKLHSWAAKYHNDGVGHPHYVSVNISLRKEGSQRKQT